MILNQCSLRYLSVFFFCFFLFFCFFVFVFRSIRLTVKFTKRFDHDLTHKGEDEHPVCTKQNINTVFVKLFVLAVVIIIIIKM